MKKNFSTNPHLNVVQPLFEILMGMYRALAHQKFHASPTPLMAIVPAYLSAMSTAVNHLLMVRSCYSTLSCRLDKEQISPHPSEPDQSYLETLSETLDFQKNLVQDIKLSTQSV